MNTKYTMIGTCTLHYLLVDEIFSKHILNLVFYKKYNYFTSAYSCAFKPIVII
jgi:hypothetical protein